MEKEKRAILITLGAILIFSIALFLYFFIRYVPAKDISAQESSGNNQSIDKSTGNMEEEKSIDDDIFNGINNQDENEETTISSKSNVRVELIDQGGLKIPDVACDLESASLDSGEMKPLYTKRSDQNGECYFYGLDSSKSYVLVVYWTNDRAIVTRSSLGALVPDQTLRRTMVRPGKTNVSSPAAENVSDVNLPKNIPGSSDCYDSDAGDPYVKGFVSFHGNMFTDYCTPSATAVTEETCSATKEGKIIETPKTIPCTTGCRDGACIR